MADQTPPGPSTSGRIAGVIALVALVLGGYYAVTARPVPKEAEAPAASATAPAEAPAEVASADDAQKGAVPSASPDGGAPSEKQAATATPATDGSAPAPAGGDAGQDGGQTNASTDGASAAPGLAETAAAQSATRSTGEPTPPSFDVVRVEPSGEAVIAGLAEPKADVEILDGSTVAGKGEANERGEWAIIVDKPLVAGTHDLSIRTTSPDGKTQMLSEQRVAIAVPEPGKGEPLVVLNTPEAPSKILQRPEEPKTAATQQGETKPSDQASQPPGKGTAVAAADATPQPADQASSASDDASASEAGAGDVASAPAAEAGGTTGTGAGPADMAAGSVADAGKAATGGSAQADSGAPTGMAAEVQSPQPAADTAEAAAPKVTVDAVEFENGTIYIAGSAATGGIVRIYVDGVAVGDAKADESGRWLLETKHDMKPGEHTVRADQIDKDSGNVIVRAEVPFQQTGDVAILAPVTAEGGTSTGASGSGTMPAPQNVIIRRGDNLWTISRRLYGKGIRYSTIYEANSDQIRDPHWIYPGQIFVLPAGDARWTN